MSEIENAAGSKLFTGMIGPAYSAFNGRDPYYREMSLLVVAEALQARKGDISSVLELGAGTGEGTRVILDQINDLSVTAIEPNESMRYFLSLNTMGDSRVNILPYGAEEIMTKMDSHSDIGVYDAVMCCQMFHFLGGNLAVVLSGLSQALEVGGVITFDLGPSNYASWKNNLHDFRSGTEPGENQIITELSHPLYQIAHGAAYSHVKETYPDFNRENLWAPPAKALSIDSITAEFNSAGFDIVRNNEFLVPIEGRRIIDFVRNAWTTWCRWAPLDQLPINEKIAIVEAGLEALSEAPPQLKAMVAYHPSVIITARKR